MFLLTIYSFLTLCSPDTNVVLKTVEISGDRFEVMTGGRIIEQSDSITKSAMYHSSLDHLLEFNSSMYVKNYGPGTLSSLTMRGGSSYHTAVLWNGFQITNPMNGQLDFALLQNFFFDRMDIQHGGASALWGSGAVSGVINLHDNTYFNSGCTTQISATYNSMGNLREMISASYGNKQLSVGLKFFNDYSSNKFDYLKNNIQTTQSHSLSKSSGALADISYFTGKQSILSIGIWTQTSQREIGPVMTQSSTDAEQHDASTRLSAEWKTEFGKNRFAVRSAFMSDKINYSDSLLDQPSNATNNHLIAETEYSYAFNDHHLLFAGINIDHNSALTNEYPKEISLSRSAVYMSYRFSIPKLVANASVRKENSSLNNPPLIYSAGFTFTPTAGLSILASGGNVFRNPTINDLYWKPGGNPELLPEKGFTEEASLRIDPLQLSKVNSKFQLLLEATYFDKSIDNWIAWTPTGSYWAPMNIKSVHLRRRISTQCQLFVQEINSRLELQFFTYNIEHYLFHLPIR
ncbi:MAG: TonB-dependent receptor [Bacteroidetes bacterium]|nr:TonB-dependent receptor [Bacteroidota bacterium]